MASPIGMMHGLTPGGVAKALKGAEWGAEIDGTMYDVEFTGEVVGGNLEVKVKRKSRSQQQRKVKSE